MARARKKKQLSAREAKELETFDALKGLLDELGWQVNQTKTLPGRGGHCVVHGNRRVILQSGVPTSEKTDVLVDALRRENLDDVHVRPDLRELIFPGSLDESDNDEPPTDEPAAAAG